MQDLGYIYIIISEVGFAIMMLVVYFRYSKFRISSANEIRDLKVKLDKETSARQDAEFSLIQSGKEVGDRLEKLLREVSDLRKEKEDEIRLRLEAEKQIDLALQKVENIQRRMSDWKLIQDSSMQDCKDAIVQVGNDLYKKLSDSYKFEVDTNKNLFGRLTKTIEDYMRPASAEGVKKNAVVAAKTVQEGNVPTGSLPDVAAALPSLDSSSKNSVMNLIEVMKADGYLAGKDYFTPANFDEAKARLLLCELAFVKEGQLEIIDFKGNAYFKEFNRVPNKTAALELLKKRIEKYFVYLTNIKYRDSIVKAMLTKTKFETSAIIIALETESDVRIMKDLGYYEQASKLNIEVMHLDEISNIVL